MESLCLFNFGLRSRRKKHFKNQTIKLVWALPQDPKVLCDFTWFVSMLFSYMIADYRSATWKWPWSGRNVVLIFITRSSHLLDNLTDCLMCTYIAGIMGSNPVGDTWNFSGAHMRQSLRLSSKCDDHFFNWHFFISAMAQWAVTLPPKGWLLRPKKSKVWVEENACFVLPAT